MRFATKGRAGAPQLVRHHTSISRVAGSGDGHDKIGPLNSCPRFSRSPPPSSAPSQYARTPHCGDSADPARPAQGHSTGTALVVVAWLLRGGGDGGEGDTSDHAMQRRPWPLLCYCYALSVACCVVWCDHVCVHRSQGTASTEAEPEQLKPEGLMKGVCAYG